MGAWHGSAARLALRAAGRGSWLREHVDRRVAVADEGSRTAAGQVASALRARGVATEVAPSAAKFGKQIRFADRRGIPFVWFTDRDGGHEVKDIRSGEQVPADPTTWMPPEQDLRPGVVPAPPADS